MQCPENRPNDLMRHLDNFRRFHGVRQSTIPVLATRQDLSDFNQGSWSLIRQRSKGMTFVFPRRSNAGQHERAELASELPNCPFHFPWLYTNEVLWKCRGRKLEAKPARGDRKCVRTAELVVTASTPPREAWSRAHGKALGDRNFQGCDPLTQQLRSATRNIRPGRIRSRDPLQKLRSELHEHQAFMQFLMLEQPGPVALAHATGCRHV